MSKEEMLEYITGKLPELGYIGVEKEGAEMTPKEELKKLVTNMNDKQFEWFVAQLQNLQRNAEKCRT